MRHGKMVSQPRFRGWRIPRHVSHAPPHHVSPAPPRHVSHAFPVHNTPTPETGLNPPLPYPAHHGMVGYAYTNPLPGLTHARGWCVGKRSIAPYDRRLCASRAVVVGGTGLTRVIIPPSPACGGGGVGGWGISTSPLAQMIRILYLCRDVERHRAETISAYF